MARIRTKSLLATAWGLGLMSTLAAAPADAADRSVATNVLGVRAIPAPAEGFDPLTATPETLTEFGFPHRPDAVANPEAYRLWKRAVTAPTTRIVPDIEVTDTYNGPRPEMKIASTVSKSTNWSGFINTAKVTALSNASFGFVASDFVVPWVLQPLKTCGSEVFTSVWVGLDGINKDTALPQAGVAGSSSCKSGQQTLSYQTWFEWFPLSQMTIKNFAASPGDDYYVAVEAESSTKALAYIVNLVTNVSASITFTAPAKSKLIGNAAEWIVEAPTVSGGQSALANYAVDYFAGAYAETFAETYSYPGTPGTGITSLESDMINKAGTVISKPYLTGPSSIYFEVEGPAR